VQLFKRLFKKNKHPDKAYTSKLKNVFGFKPKNISLFTIALSHRSIKEGSEENNERLEYLGDAILSAIVADYLYKKYPYKGEGFLTEMRSKMVNRQRLNEVALKMGLKQLTQFNRFDNSLKTSQIFGNTLEAVVGAVYLDMGYAKTKAWVLSRLINPHFIMDDLENLEINHKNKLYGWANRNGKVLEFDTLEERMEGSRRVFRIGATVDGEVIAEGVAYNKKDASQIAAQIAIDKLSLNRDNEEPAT
jgi:ribonuclease III